MTNAGTKIVTENLKKKEVFLNKDLRPIIAQDISTASFDICYWYNDDMELVKITFTSKDNNYPNFEIPKKFINRYLSFKRPDDKFLEILRQHSLNSNDIIALKKYTFECKKYIIA